MDTEQKHILIVDDSQDDRNMVAFYLSHKGYRVTQAADGKDALEKALELQPHVILMDLWLPIVSGWEVIQRLKADERTRHVPILVITGHSFVRRLECDGSFPKPCPLDQLAAGISKMLKARGKAKTVPRQAETDCPVGALADENLATS